MENCKTCEILFQEGGVVSIKELSFLKHNNKGNDHVVMVSHVERDVEEDATIQSEGEPSFDRMAQHGQNLFKFMNFIQMDFNTEHHLAITKKAIIELIDP